MKKLLLLILLMLLTPALFAQTPPPPGAAPKGYRYILVQGGPLGTFYLPNAYELLGCTTDTGLHTVTCGSGAATHVILDSAVHTDTLTGTVLRGDVIVGNATPKWSRLTIGAADSVFHSDGTDATWKNIPDCDDSAGQHLNYDTTSNGFTCGTSGAAASLTVGSTTIGSGTNGRILYDNSGVLGELAIPLASSNGGTGNAFTKFTGPTTSEKTFTLPDSSQTIETQNNKDAASGYASLTAGTKLNIAQGQEVWASTDLSDFAAKSGSGTTIVGATMTSLTTNDLLKWNGSNWVNIASAPLADAFTSNPSDCAAGLFANSIGANGNLGCTNVSAGDAMPLYRKITTYQVPDNSVTTCTVANGCVNGSTNPSTSGTITAVAWVDAFALKFATSTSVGGKGGYNGPSTVTMADARPLVTARFKTPASLPTDWSFNIGVRDGATAASCTSGSDASRTAHVASSSTINSGAFCCCGGDGTTRTCTNLGGTALATSTIYVATMDYSVAGVITCTVTPLGGTTISGTTTANLPTGTTALDINVQCTTQTAGTANSMEIEWVKMTHN